MRMWSEYVPVATRRAKAKNEMDKLRKKGRLIKPVEINGRKIAEKFWGKKWCAHLESLADYRNRLPRGSTYVRNGSVCHLDILEGVLEAFVSGSSLYNVKISIEALAKEKWEAIKKRCQGQVGSILELLQGKISDQVMNVVADSKEGLFPLSNEMRFSCSCPDWAGMCKHVAAVLYGVGSRLDHSPELLFVLRGVNPGELVSTHLKIDAEGTEGQLIGEDLGDIFGIDIEAKTEKQPSMTVLLNGGKTPKNASAPKLQKSVSKKHNIDQWDGESLRAFRDRRGLTVIELAEILGVTPASIYRWEQSKKILKLRAWTRKALEAYINQE